MLSIHLSHYALLQVPMDAPAQQVDAAYRERLAVQPRGALAQKVWFFLTGESPITLLDARDTLTEQDARRRYDRKLAEERWYWIPMT